MTDSSDPDRSDGGFDDPTAPTWTGPDDGSPTGPSVPGDATQPVATGEPTRPFPAADPPFPQQPAAPSPYGQAPYVQPPYGSAQYDQLGPVETPYGQQPYGSTAYGQPPYALPPAPYGPPPQNGSALALTIVSAIATLMCCLFSLPALVLGIVALSKQSSDPQGSARLARWGWFALAGGAALAVIAVVIFFVIAAAGGFDGGSYDYQGA